MTETLPNKRRDKMDEAQGDTKGVTAVSGNNNLIMYRKTSGQPNRKECDAIGELHLKVNEGELRLDRGISGVDGQWRGLRYACCERGRGRYCVGERRSSHASCGGGQM